MSPIRSSGAPRGCHILLSILLVLTGLAPAALAQDTAPTEVPKTFPYDPHIETLDNGLKVILIPMSSGGLAAYWTIVRTGSRDEVEPGRTGFAHFFEHMMFRGTEKFPADAYNKLVTQIGASTNAFTTDDLTGYFLDIASEDIPTVMEIESDRFQNLAYPKDMFETEAGAVYGEYRKNRTNPFFYLFEAMTAAAFEEHTYGHTTMGYEEDIANMPTLFDYSKGFFDRFYRPDNTVLVIVGDFEVGPVMEQVKQYYGEWEAGYQPPAVPTEPPQTEERRIDVQYPGPALPIAWMAYKVPAFDPTSVSQAAARLLCDLTFGTTSAIYKKLVLEEQLVDFISADITPRRDPGTLDVLARIKDPAKVDQVLAEIDRVIAEAKETPPDAQRLADLKSRLRYDFLMNLDTPAKVMSPLTRIIAVTGGLEAIDQMYHTIDQVTPEDVQKAAQEYFEASRRTVGVLRGES